MPLKGGAWREASMRLLAQAVSLDTEPTNIRLSEEKQKDDDKGDDADEQQQPSIAPADSPAPTKLHEVSVVHVVGKSQWAVGVEELSASAIEVQAERFEQVSAV